MMDTRQHGPRAQLALGMSLALTVGMLVAGQTVLATGPAAVGLGTAASFAVLAGTPSIASTGATTINGDLGIAPAAAVTGFPPGVVHGTTHLADAVALQAKNDLTTAYVDAAGRPVTATHATLGGLTLAAGVYTAGGATLDLTGTLTLDAANDPNAIWIFKATSDLVTASASTVRIINGGQACNVFWQVTSSATLGSGSSMVGTIMALTSITMASGVTVEGRALARNGTVTLIDDTVSVAQCSSAPSSSAPSASAPSASAPSASAPSATLPATDTVATVLPGESVPGLMLILFLICLAPIVLLALTVPMVKNRRR